MARRKIVMEKIVVHNNGDKSGKGEMYWTISANGSDFATRDRKDDLKTKDGATIWLSDTLTVSGLNGGDTLTVEGDVSEKDGILSGSDESARFSRVYSQADNWGLGSHSVRLTDHPLDVTLHYRIEQL